MLKNQEIANLWQSQSLILFHLLHYMDYNTRFFCLLFYSMCIPIDCYKIRALQQIICNHKTTYFLPQIKKYNPINTAGHALDFSCTENSLIKKILIQDRMKTKMIREIKFWKKIKWHGSFSIKIKPFYLEFDLLQDVAVAKSSYECKIHFNTFTEEESIDVHSIQRSMLRLTKFQSRKLLEATKMFCESIPKCSLEVEQFDFSLDIWYHYCQRQDRKLSSLSGIGVLVPWNQ